MIRASRAAYAQTNVPCTAFLKATQTTLSTPKFASRAELALPFAPFPLSHKGKEKDFFENFFFGGKTFFIKKAFPPNPLFKKILTKKSNALRVRFF